MSDGVAQGGRVTVYEHEYPPGCVARGRQLDSALGEFHESLNIAGFSEEEIITKPLVDDATAERIKDILHTFETVITPTFAQRSIHAHHRLLKRGGIAFGE